MTDFLPYAVVILSLVVVFGFFNEKVTKITYEISLMLFSLLAGAAITLIAHFAADTAVSQVISDIQSFNLEDFLMDGILCFMLFSGSCHMKLHDFKTQARPVAVLSILCTLLGAVFYGLCFFAASSLIGVPLSFPACLMFGSIVAPTDPIAATSILNKFGLPKDISFLIEGESLSNDGVGVALFVCFSRMVTAAGGSGNFFTIMARELLGATAVGAVVTALCFPVFRHTADTKRRVFTSLLAVALSYVLCDAFDFSGAIASVVCGVLFSTLRNQDERRGASQGMEDYDAFWDVLDDLLNSVLYVILGLSCMHILQMEHVLAISLMAILCNFIGRSGSLFFSSFLLGRIPDGCSRGDFVLLLTWGGLRGGLCIALAMSTRTMLDADVYHIILGATYAIVFFTTIVQGLTMRRIYQGIEKRFTNHPVKQGDR